ncbi:pyruvate kinase [Ureaplasma miroungigenitalium]|uniref:pyruvate kinase n=1 Tax=Ureaplasma miroungigenitalium TaxID=1042321 RepID=UPI0021E9A4AA|nr:pyruvate kinase [Ureaplasma miroungigenitalium]MCV3734220.1 pyruvate kinase [Ureaplasma miroungigenitalium]
MFLKTRIIATIGPAIVGSINNPHRFHDQQFAEERRVAEQKITDLILRGVNIFRLNLSHNTIDNHLFITNWIREIAERLKISVQFIFDTKGPEIRVGQMSNNAMVKANDILTIYTKKQIVGDDKGFSVSDVTNTYSMADDVKVGSQILVDDGKLVFEAVEVDQEAGIIKAKSYNGFELKTNKRINLPNTKYSIPFLSDKDKNDIKKAIENKIDFLALSFIANSAQLQQVYDYINSLKINTSIRLIAKIENQEAIDNINSLIAEFDAIMIARGDLGLEINYARIPFYQEKIIRLCRLAKKPVIVATQMLDSLEKNILPTRAEVNDVYHAVKARANAVMLSGETAAGIDPVNAVNVLNKIIFETEKTFFNSKIIQKDICHLEIERKLKKDVLEFSLQKSKKPKYLLVNTVQTEARTIQDIAQHEFGFTTIFNITEHVRNNLILRDVNLIFNENPIKTKKELAEILQENEDAFELLIINI